MEMGGMMKENEVQNNTYKNLIELIEKSIEHCEEKIKKDYMNNLEILHEGMRPHSSTDQEIGEQKEDLQLRKDSLLEAIESSKSLLESRNAYSSDTNYIVERAQSFYAFLKGDKHGS